MRHILVFCLILVCSVTQAAPKKKFEIPDSLGGIQDEINKICVGNK